MERRIWKVVGLLGGITLALSLALATGMWKNLPEPAEAASLSVQQREGHATWYSLCDGSSGSGACGYCDDTEMHAAWPHLDQTNCHRYCPASPVDSVLCGAKVTVSNWCPHSPVVEVEIRDCCTCDGTGGCNGTSRCNGTSWSSGDVVIDLTTEAFRSLHGGLSDGRIPVRVYYDY